jgi:glycosyltransferase involved in cell wall biosynthesis
MISIITISYNCAEAIERTIRSVIAQQYSDYEYIIIDGGSTDGTVDVIRKYEQHLTYWISERDRGISDAFNKGIAVAKGNYINLLNAGDTLISPSTLGEIAPHLDAPLVTFRFTEENSGETSHMAAPEETDLEKKALLGHQATFVQTEVYRKFGAYSTSYRIRMDFDFFLRALPYNKLKAVDLVIVSYNAGLSGSIKHRLRYEAEGLTSVFLNRKKPASYLLRAAWQPLLRVATYIAKQKIKKLIRYKPKPAAPVITATPALKRANP